MRQKGKFDIPLFEIKNANKHEMDIITNILGCFAECGIASALVDKTSNPKNVIVFGMSIKNTQKYISEFEKNYVEV